MIRVKLYADVEKKKVHGHFVVIKFQVRVKFNWQEQENNQIGRFTVRGLKLVIAISRDKWFFELENMANTGNLGNRVIDEPASGQRADHRATETTATNISLRLLQN